jgi:glycosyltransferase involved in cell wall biosynthesis
MQIAEDIKRKYGRDSAIIPNGVILPQISKSDDVLRKFDLVGGKYVLSVGRLVPEKGFHDLIEAFKELKSEEWRLVIVGGADHKDDYSLGLREKARKYDDVILTGFLTGKPLQELYTHAGLFVLPSYYEGLPIALLEAMSYGLSCIASDIPANREVGLPEERFFNVGDIRTLIERIEQFIRRPLSKEERNKQIIQVGERYDWEKVAEQTFEVYRKVCERKNR